MPAKLIEVPGVGTVEFPDSMSDDEISKKLSAHVASLPKPEAPKDERGFLKSAWDKINPLPAIQEWIGRSGEMGKAVDAMTVYRKVAEEDPANKGLPPAKQKLRPFTAEEQAIIDRGMSANLQGAEGNILHEATAPAIEASGQAAQGNYKGAAGTLVGGYVAPVVIGKLASKVPAGIRAATEEMQKPGTGQIIKGGAQMVAAAPTAMIPHVGVPAATLLGERGLANILEGIRTRRASGIPEAELFKPPEPVAAEPVAVTPQPVPETDPVHESALVAAESQPAATIKTQATQAPVTPPEPAFVPPTGTRWGTMSRTQVERGYLEMLNRKGKLNPEQTARLAEMKGVTPEAPSGAVPESPVAANPEPAVTKIPFSDEAKTAATSAKMEALNRSLKTDTLSRVLKDAGVDLADVEKWKPTGPEWKAVTYAANEILKSEGKSTTMGHPSKQSIAETLFKLRKAAAPKVEGLAIAGKPAALAAAQALADEMAKQ